MTPGTSTPPARRFVERCNGAEPGQELDEAQAQETLQRALDRGFRVSGSLNLGSVSWHDEKLDRTFSLTEVSDTAFAARHSGWGPQ
jgi:ribosome assembly protein YihI (activator of Der GTPase)